MKNKKYIQSFPAIGLITYNGQTIANILLKVVGWLLSFAGAVAVLALIYAGILFITSAGNSERQQSAKRALTNAIFGIIIIVLSFVIVFVVGKAVDGAF